MVKNDLDKKNDFWPVCEIIRGRKRESLRALERVGKKRFERLFLHIVASNGYA